MNKNFTKISKNWRIYLEKCSFILKIFQIESKLPTILQKLTEISKNSIRVIESKIYTFWWNFLNLKLLKIQKSFQLHKKCYLGFIKLLQIWRIFFEKVKFERIFKIPPPPFFNIVRYIFKFTKFHSNLINFFHHSQQIL